MGSMSCLTVMVLTLVSSSLVPIDAWYFGSKVNFISEYDVSLLCLA